MIDPVRICGGALLAAGVLLVSPFVCGRAVEVWRGDYDEPLYSGATPDYPAWDDGGGMPPPPPPAASGYNVALLDGASRRR